MKQLVIDLSDELHARIVDAAEQDHPGGANVNYTAARLLAWCLLVGGPPTVRSDVAPPRPSPLPFMPEENRSALVPPAPVDLDAAQAQLRRRRAEAGLDPATGLAPLKSDRPTLVDAARPGADPGPPPRVMP